MLAQFGCIDTINIVKEGTCGLEASVKSSAGLPREFAADPVVVLQQKVGAEDRVSTTAQAYGVVVSGSA